MLGSIFVSDRKKVSVLGADIIHAEVDKYLCSL